MFIIASLSLIVTLTYLRKKALEEGQMFLNGVISPIHTDMSYGVVILQTLLSSHIVDISCV